MKDLIRIGLILGLAFASTFLLVRAFDLVPEQGRHHLASRLARHP